jgi:glycosyltransferase involved in cell wall biosynthesis
MSSQIRVLQFSTHDEECGIAKYQEQFIQGMSGTEGFYTEYFPHSPNKTKHMNETEFNDVLRQLIKQMESFDILHIQHELSFFKHYELRKIIDSVKRINKKVIVTVHTAPDAQHRIPKLGGLGPRSILHYARSIISSKRFMARYVTPLNEADLILVHNQATANNLHKYGVEEQKMQVIRIPVPKLSFTTQSTEIKQQLDYQKGDIIFCTVGFLSRTKGIDHAVKALSFLPKNYKLAIIGGSHPDGGNEEIYDEISDLIERLSLKERVYITGYVKEDDQLNALIRECDICVYPFHRQYYSFVSSASLNNAIANHKPIIAYKTDTFIEVNQEIDVITFCASANYYELARDLKRLYIKKSERYSEQYARLYSYDKEAADFIHIYRQLA